MRDSFLGFLRQDEDNMNDVTIPLHEEPLEKLVADHQRLKKELGPDHFLVQQLWAEIRRRNEVK